MLSMPINGRVGCNPEHFSCAPAACQVPLPEVGASLSSISNAPTSKRSIATKIKTAVSPRNAHQSAGLLLVHSLHVFGVALAHVPSLLESKLCWP